MMLDVQNQPRFDQAIPSISIKAPLETEAILDTITQEPELEKINRRMFWMGLVFMLVIVSLSIGGYIVSR